MANIIDGKLVSKKIREMISGEVATLKEQGTFPKLAVILVGNDPASAVYVRNKHKGCLDVGFKSFQIELPKETTEEELVEKIEGVKLIVRAENK